MASIMASPAQRRPFAEIGTARLGQLSAMKNTQNAITEAILQDVGKMGDKQPIKSQFTFCSPTKRPIQASSIFDDDDPVFDAENIDPSAATSKRSKGLDGNPSKKTFHLEVKPAVSQAPDMSSMPVTRTAPAGRSPKHKRVGILSRKRAPGHSFRAIHPPSFGLRKSSSNTLGFSIDAALNGTLASRSTNAEPEATSVSAQPKGWFFAIHEDTAEEEAGILMEHSCLTLDISSDDEAGPSRRDRLDKGKENIPPEDHQSSQQDTQLAASLPTKHRRSAGPDLMTDEDRSPLGSLSAEDFYSEGLDATSVVVVVPEPDEKAEQSDASPTEPTLSLQEPSTVVMDQALSETSPQSEELPAIVVAEDSPSCDS